MRKDEPYIIEPDMWDVNEPGHHVYVDCNNEFRVALEFSEENGHYYSPCESWKLKGESLTYYESGAVYYYDLSRNESTCSPYISAYDFGRESIENEKGDVVVPIEIPQWAIEHFEESENRQQDGEFVAIEFARAMCPKFNPMPRCEPMLLTKLATSCVSFWLSIALTFSRRIVSMTICISSVLILN